MTADLTGVQIKCPATLRIVCFIHKIFDDFLRKIIFSSENFYVKIQPLFIFKKNIKSKYDTKGTFSGTSGVKVSMFC